MTTGGWRAAGILFAVFGAGSLAGAAVMEVMHEEPQAQEGRRGGRGGSAEAPSRFGDSDRFVRYLESRLQITEEQSSEIREILTRNGEQTSSLYESIRPRLESGVEEARAQIREVLTTEQVERFDALLTEERGRRRSGRDRGPDGPPGPKPDGPPKGSSDAPGGEDGPAPSAPDAPPEGQRDRDHDHRGSGTDRSDEVDPTGQRLGPVIRA